jgi:sialate O-acetylesterase
MKQAAACSTARATGSTARNRYPEVFSSHHPDTRMRTFLSCFVLILTLATAPAGEKPLTLASLFTDNMVLQQQQEVPIWGYAASGATVSVNASWGERASTVAHSDGSWILHLSTPVAGGPHTLELRSGSDVRVLNNVLTGEVWICSGQSNMEMPLSGWPPSDTIANSARDIQAADLPRIRLFTVTRASAPVPEESCIGSWSECSPANAGLFSATAFHFGRELHAALGVPVGLIQTTWGGTPVEAWTNAEYLSRLSRYDSTLQLMREAERAFPAFKDWVSKLPVIEPVLRDGVPQWNARDFHDDAPAARQFADTAWPVMVLPTIWENGGLGEFDGVVWFRKQITIPAAWLHQELIMEPGPIDDMDITYVNGTRVGGTEAPNFWNKDRLYRIPAELVDSTVLSVAVRVTDMQGGGGLYAPSGVMTLHPAMGTGSVSLTGEWKYLPTALYRSSRFYSLGIDGNVFAGRPRLPIEVGPNTPASLYNAMIAPLVPYCVRGAIWYQGESNTGDPEFYRTQFPLMIRNWRTSFQNPAMPFYYVQIAPFDYGKETESAYLREAQFMTLSLAGTGMAVTMDIGLPKNVHPSNKTDVGKRLALWALGKTYGRPVEYSGPLYAGSRIGNRRITLTFDHAGRGLVLKPGKEGNGFQIAGPDHVFRDAKVSVQGKTVFVWHPAILDPQAVRYAFTNTASGTLFNKEGLPASSFRTDAWPR